MAERDTGQAGPAGLFELIEGARDINFLSLRAPVNPESRRLLLRGADAVLANSSHEPFGLVGLETMAAGGIACTGCSGEDYALGGRDALVLQSDDPREFIGLYRGLRENPAQLSAMRRAGRSTARQYAWPELLRRNLLPRLALEKDDVISEIGVATDLDKLADDRLAGLIGAGCALPAKMICTGRSGLVSIRLARSTSSKKSRGRL